MFTALLALGAVSSAVVVVSAVPIDTNSGPSLVTTSSTTSAHTPTSTSVSNAAVPKALLDDPTSSIDSDNVLPGVAPLSPPSDRVPLPDRHQRRAPSAGAGENSASASTNGYTNEQTNGVQPETNGSHNTNGNHAQTGQGPSEPRSLVVSLPIRQGPSRDDHMSSSGGTDPSFAQGSTSTSGGANRPSS
ncbi:hypothetical protein C8R42DRAFT_723550 [Lentinula raphanica]|nr:hypothetical protein C8R42DRAFT_723550 [Lentinula raphanica]